MNVWLCVAIVFVGYLLLTRVVGYVLLKKVKIADSEPISTDEWRKAFGTPQIVELPDSQEHSDENRASGIVPSSVSWVQTAHAGGAAIPKGRLGFQKRRKKGS